MEKIGFLEGRIDEMVGVLKAPFKLSLHTDFLFTKAKYIKYLFGEALYALFGEGGLSSEQSIYYSGKLADLSKAHRKWIKRGVR